MEGMYRLAVQHGKWGYFGVVRLEVDLDSTFNGVRVEFVDAVTEWRAGVQFGIAYAYEKTAEARRGASGANVKVLEVRGHPVDTTEAVAAFVAANAFFVSVGARLPSGFRLADDTGQIIFSRY